MPLASVTSVNRSVRVPSASTARSLRNSRPFERPLRREQRVGQRLRAEHLPLHQVDVEVAVVVVVEQRDAGRHDLRVVELAGHAVEVDEVETGRGVRPSVNHIASGAGLAGVPGG